MTPDPIRLASVSDIHIGHRRNPARQIVQNLYNAFPDNAQTAQLDLICFVGDFYDDLLTAPNEAFDEADPYLAYMLRLAAKNNTWLLFLEGTPSHDWKQMERILTLEKMLKTGAKLRYIKNLSIEYFEDLDLHILFVPDEWETSTEKTLAQVDELLTAKGLEQVDFAFMHGQFEYQLPPVVKAPKHDSQAYLKRVRYGIYIGHVHTFSQYGRIWAQGSFDRLAQNEEGPKGHIRATWWRSGEHEVTFVENPGAMTFLSVDCQGLSMEHTIQKLDRISGQLRDGSHLRVELEPTHPLVADKEFLIRRYPLLVTSIKVILPEEDEIIATDEQVDELAYTPITLTKDNLPGLLMERIGKREGVTAELLDAAQRVIQENK